MRFPDLLDGFAVQYYLACLSFLLPLEKRGRWRVRAVLILLAMLVTDILTIRLIIFLRLPMVIALVGSFMFGVSLFALCSEGSVWDAFFGATCGYATQHLAYAISSVVHATVPLLDVQRFAADYLILLVTILVCFQLFARKLPLSGRFRVGWQGALRSFVTVFPCALFLSILVEQFFEQSGSLIPFIVSRIYAMFCCVLTLWVQTSINDRVSVEVEYRTQQMLWEKKKEQYLLSKKSIDAVNRKFHDLKYQIAAIRRSARGSQLLSSLDEVEQSVAIYDSTISTGNEAVDTILTEHSLACQSEHIQLTCAIDGSNLDFINPVDLYILFGNLIDNAIEAVRTLDDADQRIVSLSAQTRTNMVVIQVENYYAGTIEMEDGLPKTSKDDADNHGFGMRSVRFIVEKYGGSLSIGTEGQIFSVCVLFPK